MSGALASLFEPSTGVFALAKPHLAAVTAIDLGLWLQFLVTGITWPVDLIWQLYAPVTALHTILNSGGNPRASGRGKLILGAISVWSIRMIYHLIAHGGIGHVDWRYEEFKKQGPRTFWLTSLFSVFCGQTWFLWMGSLSLYPAIRDPDTPSWAAPLGAALMLAGTGIEGTADLQMDAFVKDNGSKLHGERPKKVMDSGLWAWSRHPNYFGEWLFWFGMWVSGGARVKSSTILGPFIMAFMFFSASIPMMEKRQLERRGEAFRHYQQKVVTNFIILPPFLQQALLGAKKE